MNSINDCERSIGCLAPQLSSAADEQAYPCNKEDPGPSRAAFGGHHKDGVKDDQREASDNRY